MDNKKIVIFGAGEEGKAITEFFSFLGLDDSIHAYCDSKITEDSDEKLYYGKPIHSFEFFKGKGCIFVIGVKKKNYHLEIEKILSENGERYYNNVRDWLIENGIDSVEYDRLQCAFFHENSMDHYYDLAENEEMLNIFWGENTVFYRLFKTLNLDNVIELACGRGRHVQKYIDNANKITLVDILEKNIDFCKERYKDTDKISYYKNNGYDFEDLPSDSFSAIFSYDAMVHFEMLDIYDYLKEMNRVLKKGGMALLHHSNNNTDYRATFETAKEKHSRAFMSKELFAYLAYKAGFEIVEQIVIDWGEVRDLDCVSLIRK